MTLVKTTKQIFKAGLTGSAAALIYSASAGAQIPTPTASYSGQMSIMPATGQSMTTKIFAKANKQRMEIPVEDYTMVTLIDMSSEIAYTYAKDGVGPMGNQAMKIDFGQAAKSYAADYANSMNMAKTGQDIVAGRVCDTYQSTEGTACVTADGIALRSLSNEGDRMEMTSLTRGHQADYLFNVPNGYSIMDMSALSGGALSLGGNEDNTAGQPVGETNEDNQIQSFMQDQAHKQTKKQVKKAAKKQLGNSVGGALGGGLIGSTIGNELGKGASDLVGGLFGKKKKKKKTDKKETEEEKAE